MNPRLPTFIGIGAPKCGTTWLANCLAEHPDVFMAPMKETEFWKHADAADRLDEYRKYFSGAENEKAIGEFSVRYITLDETAERIKSSLPDSKIIVCLRNPIDQIYSNYWHLRRQGFAQWDVSDLPGTFEEAMERFPAMMIEPARYGSRLAIWYDLFPAENVKVIRFDDIKARPDEVLRETFGFVGVAPDFSPPAAEDKGSSARKGTSLRGPVADAIHKRVYHILTRWIYHPLKLGLGVRTANALKEGLCIRPIMEKLFMREGYPAMSSRTRERLKRELFPEVEKLTQLTGQDFSDWCR
jgi:hypothetical protein